MRNKKELQIILGAGLIPQKNGLIIVRLLPPPRLYSYLTN